MYSRGISVILLFKRRRNNVIFRRILAAAITIQINKLRVTAIFLPTINHSNRKLIKRDGAEIINAPTSKLTNAPDSRDSLSAKEKYAKKIIGCKSCASIHVLNTWLNTLML